MKKNYFQIKTLIKQFHFKLPDLHICSFLCDISSVLAQSGKVNYAWVIHTELLLKIRIIFLPMLKLKLKINNYDWEHFPKQPVG